MYFDIFKYISTTIEADVLTDGISAYLGLMYQNRGKTFEQLLYEVFPKELADHLNQLFKQYLPEPIPDTVQKFLNGLSEELSKAKVLRVTIAVEPGRDIVTSLSDWMRGQFPQQSILLDLDIDRSILGGIVVINEGRYIDLSLKKQVDEWFESKQAARVSELKAVNTAQ